MIKKEDPIKQVIQYDVNRCYFGNWTPDMLSAAHRSSLDIGKAKQFTITPLDNDTICNVLWYEMSYNPVRFGSSSPFKVDGLNDIMLFDTEMTRWDDTYYVTKFKQNIAYFKQVVNNDFEDFNKTGVLPTNMYIFGSHYPDYFVLSDLRVALHAIASQNIEDFKRKKYATEIINAVKKRHPNGIRNQQSCKEALAFLFANGTPVQATIFDLIKTNNR